MAGLAVAMRLRHPAWCQMTGVPAQRSAEHVRVEWPRVPNITLPPSQQSTSCLPTLPLPHTTRLGHTRHGNYVNLHKVPTCGQPERPIPSTCCCAAEPCDNLCATALRSHTFVVVSSKNRTGMDCHDKDEGPPSKPCRKRCPNQPPSTHADV